MIDDFCKTKKQKKESENKGGKEAHQPVTCFWWPNIHPYPFRLDTAQGLALSLRRVLWEGRQIAWLNFEWNQETHIGFASKHAQHPWRSAKFQVVFCMFVLGLSVQKVPFVKFARSQVCQVWLNRRSSFAVWEYFWNQLCTLDVQVLMLPQDVFAAI